MQFGVDVAFNEAGVLESAQFVGTLYDMVNVVESLIPGFEPLTKD